MQLTEHFSLKELVASDTARRHHIPNIPLPCHIMRLKNLAVRCLEPTRQHFQVPIHVNSGYRCLPVNSLVGGAETSQHLLGEAADIVPLHHDVPLTAMWEWMRDSLPTYDQLLLEHGRWIHVSCRIDTSKNRREAIII